MTFLVTGCQSVPKLPKGIECAITTENCLTFDCCLDLDLKVIKRRVRIAFMVDFCNYEISIAFGDFFLNTTLFTYEWGDDETIIVSEAVQLR